VVVFMAIYYRVSGLVANVALVLNGLLILAGLAAFSATLTLPGIAGFVLTLGIAVDANVLINERIREEVRMGKSARASVDQGYDRAFWTIFDAHITTLIAGVILWKTGTGPVQGFATSLIIGITASLFTSIVVTRLITTWLVHGRNATTVSV
jgi:preprotein translocase subunit SecD